jgi:GTP-binding protein
MDIDTPDIEEFDLETGNRLFSGTCDFILGVAALEQLPTDKMNEVAFAGRSNVGKSSLINAITGRTTLARTSHTPGRTQQLNYFNIADQLYMVDMPGYGYAQVSKSIRKEWDKLIRSYLSGRANLRCVMLLIDSRHGLKDSDLELMKMLDETAVSYRIILTKTDKIKSDERSKRVQQITDLLKKHAAAHPIITLTSAHKKAGIDQLRAIIASYV